MSSLFDKTVHISELTDEERAELNESVQHPFPMGRIPKYMVEYIRKIIDERQSQISEPQK